MGIKISYIVFLLGTYLGLAQNDSLSNPYFKSYEEKTNASLYYFDASNNFKIQYSSDWTNKYLDLKPNKKLQLGVNLSYKFIDISVGFAPGFFKENKDNENSKLYTFATRFNFKKWIQSLLFINQTGFYITDDQTEVAFPRLRTTKIGGTTSYVFNDRFSYKTLTNQKEWQTKSSGSFIPNFSFYYTNFDLNDGRPNEHRDVYEATIAPAYYYNLVIKERFLFSPGAGLGAGLSSIDGDFTPIYELSGNFKLAYNTDRFFSFVNFSYTSFTQEKKSEIQLRDNFYNLKYTIGYRFDPPKKVKEVYDTSTKKIGL